MSKLETLLTEARRAIAAYLEQPQLEDSRQVLLTLRRSLAEVIVGLPSGQKSGPLVEQACAALHVFEGSGVAGQPSSSDDLALAEQYRRHNWPGLLASMLLVPAWQSPSAPMLDDVQPWLWAEYTHWLFYTPKGFTMVGQAAEYAAHYLKRLEELAIWGARNRGSAAVKQALSTYLKIGDGQLLQLAPGSLRRLAEARGKVLKAAVGIGQEYDLPATSRFGRKLRIGFVGSCCDATAATFALIPLFEQLDPERFEPIMFVERTTETEVEAHCRAHIREFHVLPPDPNAQLELVRAAAPDVLIYATDLVTKFDNLVRLALHRIAPLQAVTAASTFSSGLPEIDLYLSGTLTEAVSSAEDYCERLGLVQGPAHVFNFEADHQEPAMEWTRELLKLPTDSVVFASTADYRQITAEIRECWAKILATVPGSRLLLHPFHTSEAALQEAKCFCAQFDRTLAVYGVGDERLAVLTEPFASRADAKAFLKVADVYLDAFPLSDAENVVASIEAGLPVVALEGDVARARRAAALLRSMNVTEQIASSTSEYEDLARHLGTDAGYRRECAAKIRQRMEHPQVFLDSLAASDAFGDLIEKAFDELVENGTSAFRKNRTPLIMSSAAPEVVGGFLVSAVESAQASLRAVPCDSAARHALGNALFEAGRASRAVTYLLAALHGGENDPVLWRDLAVALQADGKRNQAIEALEAGLRLDPKQADSWLLLIDMAESSGSNEIARDLLEALKANVPDHPQIPMIAARLGC